MNRLRHCAAALLLASLPAQGQEEQARIDLAKLDRDRQQNRLEIERLIDQRMRHDLGLPAVEDPAPAGPAWPVTTEARSRLELECQNQEAAAASSLDRYLRLRAQVERLRADTAAKSAVAPREEPFVVVPPAGTARPAQPTTAAVSTPPGPEAAARPAAPPPARPAAPSAPPPVRGLIHGSDDHLRVAQALFQAGKALVDRAAAARASGQAAEADELDRRGAEYLERAVGELEPLLAAKEPPYPALFCLGRCRELLFRHAERHAGLSPLDSPREYQQREQQVRDPFIAIGARDVVRKGARGEVETLGAWGLAAQAAVDHFKWTNTKGKYRPLVDIDSITWPGDKDR